MDISNESIEGQTIESTFCFIDISGYTALTDVHGGYAAASLIEQFGAIVNENVTGYGIVHELVGDCAFIIFPNPVVAIQSCIAIYRKIGELNEFPILRTGLHHGSALFKNGRYFGGSVNLAARVAAQAKGGEVFVTGTVANFLKKQHADGISINHIGSVALKNIPKMTELYTLLIPDATYDYVIDPVCQMQVDKATAVRSSRHREQQYWFCSLECLKRFTDNPGDYLEE